MARLHLQTKTTNGPGPVDLLVDEIHNDNFTVKEVIVRLISRVVNSDPAAVDGHDNNTPHQLQAGDFFFGAKLELYRRDGSPLIPIMPLLFLEMWFRRIMAFASAREPVECVDVQIPGSYATQGGASFVITYHRIPFVRPAARNPMDFATSLSNIGRLTVQVPNINDQYLRLEQCQIDVFVDGEYDTGKVDGARWSLTYHPATGTALDTVPLGGEALVMLLAVTKNKSNNDMNNAVGPRAKVDAQPYFLEIAQDGLGLADAAFSDLALSDEGAGGTGSGRSSAGIYLPSAGFSINHLPRGGNVTITFENTPVNPNFPNTGVWYYLSEHIAGRTDAQLAHLARKVAQPHELDVIKAATQTTTAGAGEPSPLLARFLPVKFFPTAVPQAREQLRPRA